MQQKHSHTLSEQEPPKVEISTQQSAKFEHIS